MKDFNVGLNADWLRLKLFLISKLPCGLVITKFNPPLEFCIAKSFNPSVAFWIMKAFTTLILVVGLFKGGKVS